MSENSSVRRPSRLEARLQGSRLQAVSRQANAQSEIVAEQITMAQVPHIQLPEQISAASWACCEYREDVHRLEEMHIENSSGPDGHLAHKWRDRWPPRMILLPGQPSC